MQGRLLRSFLDQKQCLFFMIGQFSTQLALCSNKITKNITKNACQKAKKGPDKRKMFENL